jgi:hypothetical protein
LYIIDVDGKLILKLLLEKQDGRVVDCIHLAQDRHQWQDLGDMVVNIQVT